MDPSLVIAGLIVVSALIVWLYYRYVDIDGPNFRFWKLGLLALAGYALFFLVGIMLMLMLEVASYLPSWPVAILVYLINVLLTDQ